MTNLTAVPKTDIEREREARREAWEHAMRGFEGALSVHGLAPEDRGLLAACLADARSLAGHRRLGEVN